MNEDYRYGTLRYTAWQGKWKSSPDDEDDFEEKYFEEQFWRSTRSLCKWLKSRYKHGSADDCECYVRGDSFGDKTHQIEIVRPQVLTLIFLNYLQDWLKSDWQTWRVLVSTYLELEDLIVVYPDAIRISPAAEGDLETGLQNIRQRMLRFKDFAHAR
jgi:hypothetical protein